VRSYWLLSGLGASILLLSSPIHAAELSLRPATSAPLVAADTRATQIEEIRITRDGFFIRTTGDAPNLEQDLSRDPCGICEAARRQLTVELKNTQISDSITPREFTIDRYGVSRIKLDQDGDTVEITLEFADDSLQWRASSSRQGVVLVPTGGLAAAPPDSRVSLSLTAVERPKPEPRPTQPDREALPERYRPNLSPPITLPDVSDRNVTIAIDPGHGGGDPGAVGIGGLQETDIVLDIGLQVTTLLEDKGVNVILTRRDDREIELEPRVAQANRAQADLFVSIHANAISMSRPDVNGIETYYYADQSQALARTIHNSILDATGRPDRRVRTARFYVLRNTAMPAVLLEVGFVTGAEDAPLLSDSDYRQRVAEAIARGILEYVQANL
jgi:N-acetylmuramoyl-L-alanine amidase